MMSNQQQDKCLARLKTLRYFPAQDDVAAEILRMLGDLCKTDAEAEELVDLVLRSHDEWPGPATIREIYASRVAARKAREDRTVPCEICDSTGFRPVFEIHKRLPDNSTHVRRTYPESYAAQANRITEMRARCKEAGEELYTAVCFCSCPLGRQAKAAQGQP